MAKKHVSPVVIVDHYEQEHADEAYGYCVVRFDYDNYTVFDSGDFEQDFIGVVDLGYRLKELGLIDDLKFAPHCDEFVTIAGYEYTRCECCNGVTGIRKLEKE